MRIDTSPEDIGHKTLEFPARELRLRRVARWMVESWHDAGQDTQNIIRQDILRIDERKMGQAIKETAREVERDRVASGIDPKDPGGHVHIIESTPMNSQNTEI